MKNYTTKIIKEDTLKLEDFETKIPEKLVETFIIPNVSYPVEWLATFPMTAPDGSSVGTFIMYQGTKYKIEISVSN